ncbi:MAG: tRNA preQ1(34) S-adenosylmethionine ribosyltransferase-isomerase QueA [Planctomycetota bacterium]|nr:tRNA preQ1(34) S-adenosylmethionine ribosyltransferase-isomerase QueA [Planctomycetota bacterium]
MTDELLNHISSYDYHLPRRLIAQKPATPRDSSRLLVFDRATGNIEHTIFHSFPDYLSPRDVLVINDTKVFNNRLYGHRKSSGGKVEVFLLEPPFTPELRAITRSGGKLKEGELIAFPDTDIECEILALGEHGERRVSFNCPAEELQQFCERFADVPLPPYIDRPQGATEEDVSRYQTVYAKRTGAVAAPTAGFHFTDRIFEQIKLREVQVENITLHVGRGTFEPVRTDDISQHVMHSEYYEISDGTALRINEARENGGRVIPVGTTCVRVLETVADGNGVLSAASGETDIFIRPPYEYRACDALLTNFHLPKSTLLMLVAAFAGRRNVLKIYEKAVALNYRFFSYGDAMFLQ